MPDHIAVAQGLTRNAPPAIAAQVEARAANPGRVSAPWWGVLLEVPSGGSITGANNVLDPIRTAGGVVFFGIETVPSAANTENVLTVEASLDGVNYYAASGTTPSLGTPQALTAIACTSVTLKDTPPWVRLTVSAAANNGVTDAYVIKYGIRYTL